MGGSCSWAPPRSASWATSTTRTSRSSNSGMIIGTSRINFPIIKKCEFSSLFRREKCARMAILQDRPEILQRPGQPIGAFDGGVPAQEGLGAGDVGASAAGVVLAEG